MGISTIIIDDEENTINMRNGVRRLDDNIMGNPEKAGSGSFIQPEMLAGCPLQKDYFTYRASQPLKVKGKKTCC